jgi:hypothetical protein
MSRGASEYSALVGEWRDIFAKPISDEEKQEACFAVLRRYIEAKAISHARHPNAHLRFFAVMVSLRSKLNPMFATDHFGKLVIWPMYWLVDEWVRTRLM